MNRHKYRKRIWAFGLFLVLLTGCSNNNWKVKETQNLTIYYKSGSYAEANLLAAEKAYENSFNVAEQMLPKINKTTKLKVYLYDTLKNKGFAKVEKREVHFRYGEVFRLTSVHEFLHVFLYELNPQAPLRLEEGICRINEGKRKKVKGQVYQIMYYQLVKLSPKESWVVEDAFLDHYENDDQGNVAAAFVLYAMQELGKKQFWEFYQSLNKDNGQKMIKKYFGKSPEVMNQEFKVFIDQIPNPPEAFKYKFSSKTAYMHQ